jgi:ABC-2 type transport system permease protein
VIELGAGFTPDLPARDNAILNAILLGLSPKEARARLDDIIAFAELEDFTDLALKNYSSGMRSRLAFAVAIQADAEILLVDEVLAVGDAGFRRKCFAEFDRMKREGRTVVLVTHEMDMIEGFCDRAILLEHGRVVSAGEPGEIARAYEAVNTRPGSEAGRTTVGPPGAVLGPLPHAAPLTVSGRSRYGPSALGDDLRYFAAVTAALARTDFKLHYLGSVLGYLWAVLRPLTMFGVLYLVMTQVVPFGRGVDHYPVYLLTAIVLFTYFSEATSRGVSCLVGRRGLLGKIRFPRMAIPLAATLTALFNLGLNLIAVVVLALASGLTPRLSWLVLPLLILILVLFATGLSMLLSVLYARYRDTGQVWAVALQILFYASPVLYVISRYPDSVQSIMVANPLAAVFTEVRHVVIDPNAPSAAEAIGSPVGLLIPLGLVFGVCALGLWFFQREAPGIAERL